MELVDEAGGISFFNDSKATNADAAEKAVKLAMGGEKPAKKKPAAKV